MKAIFFTALFWILLILSSSVKAQIGYTITAHIQGLDVPYVYYNSVANVRSNAPIIKRDSASVKNGHFRIQGRTKSPFMMVILTSKSLRRAKQIPVFVENHPILIQGDFAKLPVIEVSGSVTYDIYHRHELEKSRSSTYKALDSLSREVAKARGTHDTTREESLREAINKYSSRYIELDEKFVRTHPTTVVSAFLLAGYFGTKLSADKRKELLAGLSPAVQSSAYGQYVAESIQLDRMGQPGDNAFLFVAKDLANNEFKLADLQGRYVLLDFWASWCGPCRKNNPHLRMLYEKYHAKGLDVVGVADDDSKPVAWKTAVEKDQLPWYHVLRGDKTENDIYNHFSVKALPTYILLDKQSKILERYEGNPAKLEQKLAELMP